MLFRSKEGLRITTKLLWMAIVGGHEAVVKLLVDRDDVEADSKDIDGQTPLWEAVGNGRKARSEIDSHLFKLSAVPV